MKVTSMACNSLTILAETEVEARILEMFQARMSDGGDATIRLEESVKLSDGRVSSLFFVAKPKPEGTDQ